MAIVRTLKRQQRDNQHRWVGEQKKGTVSYSFSGVSPSPLASNAEGWIGNPLDPIGSLFDTLAEASLAPDSKPLDAFYGAMHDQAAQVASQQAAAQPTVGNGVAAAAAINNSLLIDEPVAASASVVREKPKYHHVLVPGSHERCETYLCLAVEAALIGLGQQRLMPAGSYSQDKAIKQENSLITKLQDIELDNYLIAVLRKQALCLLEGGPYSGLGQGIHAESTPMHTFAKYLFNALLPFDPDTAHKVGLRAMRWVTI